MTSQDVFYSKGKNDECWTPDYGVKPMFEQRMRFVQNGKSMGSPTFSSAYFCADFLPKQIIMEKLDI